MRIENRAYRYMLCFFVDYPLVGLEASVSMYFFKKGILAG